MIHDFLFKNHDFLFNFLTVYCGLLGSGSKLLKIVYSIRGEVLDGGINLFTQQNCEYNFGRRIMIFYSKIMTFYSFLKAFFGRNSKTNHKKNKKRF